MSGSRVVRWMRRDWWWPARVVVVLVRWFRGRTTGYWCLTTGYQHSYTAPNTNTVRSVNRERCEGVGATDAKCLATVIVEVATGVVVTEYPRVPDVEVRYLEVRIALPERCAVTEVAFGRQTRIAITERLLPVGRSR
uniref:Uncharacterized protein n=1 Tax=Anopheles darlingi TaxID=43151 RepID=A0A2M4CVM0_ANODA